MIIMFTDLKQCYKDDLKSNKGIRQTSIG